MKPWNILLLMALNVVLSITPMKKSKRMIRFQPAELMYIYISEKDVPTIKDYLSKYGEETSYNAYHLDELND